MLFALFLKKLILKKLYLFADEQKFLLCWFKFLIKSITLVKKNNLPSFSSSNIINFNMFECCISGHYNYDELLKVQKDNDCTKKY